MKPSLLEKQAAQCAEGKYHNWIMGVCWKCGKTMKEHKAEMKALGIERAKARYHQRKGIK